MSETTQVNVAALFTSHKFGRVELSNRIVMAPMTRDATVADWMAALAIPAILVVGSYLGAISHALTAAEALAARAIPLAAVVVSESDASSVALEDTIESMARFLPGTRMITLGRLGGGIEAWREAPDLLGVLD